MHIHEARINRKSLYNKIRYLRLVNSVTEKT
jgi:hypothetical protein